MLVHGFACSHDDWKAQLQSLTGRHEVIAVDLPGHGSTPGAPEDASVNVFARNVAEILPSKSLIVGHSMGCRVALKAALLRAERVAGVVLVDGSRVGDGNPDAVVQSVRNRIAAVGYPRFIEDFFAGMTFGPVPGLDGDALRARASRLPAPFGEALFLDIVRWDATELEETLAALRIPLLAIQSTAMNAERKRVPLRAGESSPWLDFLRSTMPDARVEVVPDVGHFTQIEAADTVSRLIGEFAQTPR